MPESGQEPIITTDPTDVQTTPAEEQKPATPESVDTLPDWAQKLIKEMRSENAKHRKAKTEAEKAAEELAKKQAEEQGEYKRLYEEAEARRLEAEQKAQASELARLKSSVAQKLQLPPALVDRLRGETEEELEADAKALLDAMPKPQITASNDAASGINGAAPKPQMTEREITETAARLGLSVSALKQYYGVN